MNRRRRDVWRDSLLLIAGAATAPLRLHPRWSIAGALLGGLAALVTFAPAAWLARGVAAGSGEMFQLADARGTVWRGSARPVLTAGPGSRDAATLPGRLHWRIAPAGLGLEVRAAQACCINGELVLRVLPGWSGLRVELAAPTGAAASPDAAPGSRTLGQWPAAWLAGLGTPWNTLQPGGLVQLSTPGLAFESRRGAARLAGRAEIDLLAFSSRMSTLEALGDYRLTLSGVPAGGAAGVVADVQLATRGGALIVVGAGQWTARGLRFRGSASAAPGQEAVLNNLLNIIGRRQGAQAIISIG